MRDTALRRIQVLGAPSDATGGGDQSDIQPPSAVPVSEDQREEEGGTEGSEVVGSGGGRDLFTATT